MKSLCSTQQEVCNCFIFTYVSIWKKKIAVPVIPLQQLVPRHFPIPLLSQTTTLEISKCQPYFTSGEARGHRKAKTKSYTSAVHLPWTTPSLLQGHVHHEGSTSVSLSLARREALHGTLAGPAGKGQAPEAPGQEARWQGTQLAARPSSELAQQGCRDQNPPKRRTHEWRSRPASVGAPLAQSELHTSVY